MHNYFNGNTQSQLFLTMDKYPHNLLTTDLFNHGTSYSLKRISIPADFGNLRHVQLLIQVEIYLVQNKPLKLTCNFKRLN